MSYLTAKKTISNEEKRGIGKDYAERSKELLECIAPTKYQSEEEEKKHFLRQQQKANRQKRKRENKNKIERHSTEQKWKVNYHNDLDLQLKFRNIEYINVSSCKKSRPIFESYVKAK